MVVGDFLPTVGTGVGDEAVPGAGDAGSLSILIAVSMTVAFLAWRASSHLFLTAEPPDRLFREGGNTARW